MNAKIELIPFLFDNTQTTLLNSQGNDLSPEMKTYYQDRLIDYADPKLIHDQFGDKYPIPKNGGKTTEFRKYSPLDKAMTQLTEGVTPSGDKLDVTTVTATVGQYGNYIEISDVLELTAIDRNLEQATKLLGSQAGRTLDTVTREVINGGTNVIYAPKVSGGSETAVSSRADLDGTALLTRDVIFRAAAKLNEMNAAPIDDAFVGIVHPNIACDLMTSDGWIDVHKYAQPENIYKGEIGMLGGVRFVQTTEAKINDCGEICGIEGLKETKANAQVSSSTDVYPYDVFDTTTATAVNAAISAGEKYYVFIGGNKCEVASVVGGARGTCKIVLTAAISCAANTPIYGPNATSGGLSVYNTMIIGANAYGVTEVTGGGLQHIIKQLGSAGTADPLNQRATSGWKALKVAERLVEEYMVRVESCCKTSPKAKAN